MDKIKILNTSDLPLPTYQTAGAAGMDLHAVIEQPIILKPQQRALIPTGIHIQLQPGFEAQIRPRSGLALKNGVTVLNTPATIDSDYRGELLVLLINLSEQSFTISHGDRIAQLVIARYEQVKWQEVEVLDDNTDRGQNRFGSTGVEAL
jgi:dUTP pyrophosphatase